MKTLCYYIANDIDFKEFMGALIFAMRLTECTVSMKDVEMDCVELTITCKESDALGIQTVLAPYL